MQLGIILLGVSIILINILLILLIRSYKNNIICIKSTIENIYYKIEDNKEILKNIEEKTHNLEIDINNVKCYFKVLIDYQNTIITIDKNIFKSLNKDNNKDNNNKDKNKDVNNKNKKVDKSTQDVEYLKNIAYNISILKENFLSLSNDIYKYYCPCKRI